MRHDGRVQVRGRVSAAALFVIAAVCAAVVCLSPVSARQRRPPRDPRLQRGVAQMRGGLPVQNRPTLTAVRDRRPDDVEHAQRVQQAMADGLPYVPGELLVRFTDAASFEQRSRALRALRTGQAPPSDEQWIGDVLHVRDAGIADPEAAAAALAEQPGVLYAQPNYIRHTDADPNDPLYSSQRWNFDAIKAPQAWDINDRSGAKNNPVTVAVIDTGLTTVTANYSMTIWDGRSFGNFTVMMAKAVDFDHARVQAGRDFAGRWPMLFDADSHGTHVAGTIAQQTNNSMGFAGVAHWVTLLPVKVCRGYWDVQLEQGDDRLPGFAPSDAGGCETADVVEGIRWAADNGANVINISLGGTSPSPSERDAIAYAVQKGAFVAISAGNDAQKGNPVHYPASYAEQIDGAVAVGAVNINLGRASYSNYGSYVELAAPGGDSQARIWQVVPMQRYLAPGPAPRFDLYEGGGISGTSMAAPHVAAVAALLYSQGVRSPAAIETVLKNTARDLGAAGRDNDFGYGLVNARAALWGAGVAK